MKKILITGASGFVGSFLVEEALQKGYEVYAGIRSTSSRQYLQHERIKFFELDFSSPSQLEDQLAEFQFNYIIQNAGVTKANTKDSYFKVNAHALDHFVKAIKNSGSLPEKFIFISSLAAYGPADNKSENIVSNKSTPKPVTTYGKSKLEGERLLKSHHDFPYIIVRPTAVYGPREKDLLTVYQMINNRLEILINDGQEQLTFVYVKDLVMSILQLLESDLVQKEYFVSDGNSYSAKEFNNIVKKYLNKSTFQLNLPSSLVRILAFFTEKISSLSGNYPALNLEKVNELECNSWACDISELQKDINYTPKYDLELGLKETIEWYRNNNIL